MKKRFDVICLGRAAVDLYAQQIGTPLETAKTFAKYLGGSSANIAFGCARLGLRSSMLTRVGDEQMGRFVTLTLKRAGVDVSGVVVDKKRLTGLVLLSVKDRETFPLLFYRQDCADMALCEADFSEDYIASAGALLITGTHFSTPGTKRACETAITFAKRNGVRVIVDVDYRPVLWGLTRLEEGAERFVASGAVTNELQSIFKHFGAEDLIVGTEEEMHLAGGSENTITALSRLRQLTSALLVLKRGPLGCSIFEAEIPSTLSEATLHGGETVEVLNVLGAGDAFLSGFLRGFLRNAPLAKCARYANACGALTVSRLGCSVAIPSFAELSHYLAKKSRAAFPKTDKTLERLHRAAARVKHFDELHLLAFDHRKQFEALFAPSLAEETRTKQIRRLKAMLFEVVCTTTKALGLEGKTGFLLDARYGQPNLSAASAAEFGMGYWVGRPVERPESFPLRFETPETEEEIGLEINTWPQGQVVKCLVFYPPWSEKNSPAAVKEQMRQQDATLKGLYEACLKSENELLIEALPLAGALEKTGAETPTTEPEKGLLAAFLERLYALEIYPEWWKLAPQGKQEWQALSEVIAENDPHCRGVLLLGQSASLRALKKQLTLAAQFSCCKGFAVGRSVFLEAAKEWIAGQTSDADFIRRTKENYVFLIETWRSLRKTAKLRKPAK